jgi:hypothetical protein
MWQRTSTSCVVVGGILFDLDIAVVRAELRVARVEGATGSTAGSSARFRFQENISISTNRSKGVKEVIPLVASELG